MFARVSDPHRLNADPDHVLQSDANLRPRPTDPPRLHFERPRPSTASF
jgi:hypothetical protein